MKDEEVIKYLELMNDEIDFKKLGFVYANMKENSNGTDTNVGSIENSIEEDIERLKLCSNNQCNICGRYEKEECILERNRCEHHILSDYKRILKENERYQKSDYETICLENNELREITDRIQSEYNDLLKDNFKLKNELETKRKEYQETYKDVREELRELKKENEELREKTDINIAYAEYLEKILNEYKKESVLKQKVKDKIEELKQEIENLPAETYPIIEDDLQIKIEALEELLNNVNK